MSNTEDSSNALSGSNEQGGFAVTVVGTGLNLERTVDAGTALAIIQIVMGGPSSVQAAPSPPTSGVGSDSAVLPLAESAEGPQRRVSIRNFIDESGAKIIASKIVAAGAYLRDFENKMEFTREDIGAAFRNAREAAPTNLPRDFGSAVTQGWIAEDQRNKNHFFVTAVGDQALASKFDGVRSSPGRKKRGKKSKTNGEEG